MRRAFTLIELLLVMGIMGLLGTFAVTGFRQMYRGMEERGVMQNVDQFVRTAYQRAQIDRHPVSVYFWNETYRADEDTQTLLVVGRAVAVRHVGRISGISAVSAGRLLLDEFSDLQAYRYVPPDSDDMTDEELEEAAANPPKPGKGDGTFLYCLRGRTKPTRSLVAQYTVPCRRTEPIVTSGDPPEYPGINAYGYMIIDSRENNADWKVGDAYGQEFSFITLPQNFYFGSGKTYSENVSDPVSQVQTMTFEPSLISGGGASGSVNGAGKVVVSTLRPDKEGVLKPASIGTAPSENGGVR